MSEEQVCGRGFGSYFQGISRVQGGTSWVDVRQCVKSVGVPMGSR